MEFTKSPPFNLDVGMRQGGPRTLSTWNQVMAVLIEELLLLLWASRRPAVSWAPEWKPFEILVRADNMFLVSSSIIDIVQRTQDIEYVFGKRGLCFNQKSLEILPSKTAEKEVTRVWLNERMEFSWVSVLVVLGCYLDGSGSTETQIQGRLEQGRKMFGKMRPLLCCSRILRKNASERSIPRLFHVSCGVRVAGFRRQRFSSPFRSKKTGGFVACWVDGNPKTFCGWIGFVQRNALHMH